MSQSADQFVNTAKTAMADLNDMTATAMAGFGKLVELNMTSAQTAMADASAQLQAGFAAKAPKDVAGVTGLVQPMADQAAAYGRAVAAIVSETGLALSKSAEAKFADVQAQAVASIEAVLKQAPAGSEGAVAAFKNDISSGQAAMATAQAQAKQAADTVGKQFATATEMAVKASKTVGKTK